MITTNTLKKRILHGVVGGLVGGVVFGLMMAKMGTLPMIGKMVGAPNPVAGFLVHLAISAGIGAGYGVTLGSLVRGRVGNLVGGMVYGATWWVLGPLTLMPLFMGMGLGVNWNGAAAGAMLPSLMGHMIFGLVLGFAYRRGENCFLAKVCTPSTEEEAGERPAPRAV